MYRPHRRLSTPRRGGGKAVENPGWGLGMTALEAWGHPGPVEEWRSCPPGLHILSMAPPALVHIVTTSISTCSKRINSAYPQILSPVLITVSIKEPKIVMIEACESRRGRSMPAWSASGGRPPGRVACRKWAPATIGPPPVQGYRSYRQGDSESPRGQALSGAAICDNPGHRYGKIAPGPRYHYNFRS